MYLKSGFYPTVRSFSTEKSSAPQLAENWLLISVFYEKCGLNRLAALLIDVVSASISCGRAKRTIILNSAVKEDENGVDGLKHAVF